MTLPMYLSIKDASNNCSLGKTYLYELLNAGKIASFVVGKRRLIETASLIAYIQSKPASANIQPPPADAFKSKE